MYSLIRVWIGLKLARIEIHDRVVVRTTSRTDRPSAPTLYWIPKNGIHWATSTYWNRPPRGPLGENPITSSSEKTQVTRAKNRAIGRATVSEAKPTTIAPTSGRKTMIERSGRLEMSTSAACQDQV